MRGPSKGFTLIEMLVVLAIVAVMMAMGFAAYQRIGVQGAAQNAAHDLYSAISKARAMAQDSGSDVWLIVYPQGRRAAATGGPGAYFIVQDLAGDFGTDTGVYKYEAFDLPDEFRPAQGAVSRLVEARFLEDYPGQRVRFGVLPLTHPSTVRFKAPFPDMGRSACTMCGTNDRGAVVFAADGSARFRDADGDDVTPSGGTAQGRAVSLGLREGNANAALDTRSYLFAISGPTGYVSFFDKP
jgi:prepilin-type N-terminal cleavage/methylation domain-containing protein